MNFNILGFPYEVQTTTTTVPKIMIVTLKNEAKTKHHPEVEGIYDLTPDMREGKPQWKIRGGGLYSIGSYNERLVYGWRKIMENIKRGYGHHE